MVLVVLVGQRRFLATNRLAPSSASGLVLAPIPFSYFDLKKSPRT